MAEDLGACGDCRNWYCGRYSIFFRIRSSNLIFGRAKKAGNYQPDQKERISSI